MITRICSTLVARVCATALLMLAASPVTRPFYTFDFAELLGIQACRLCRSHTTSTIDAADRRSDPSPECVPEVVCPVETNRSIAPLIPVFRHVSLDLIPLPVILRLPISAERDQGPGQFVTLRV